MKLYGLGMIEMAIMGVFALAVRVGLAVAAGAIARGKGQSFALFLVVGLLLGGLPTLIIAAAMKPAQDPMPAQTAGFNGNAPIPPASAQASGMSTL